MFRKKSLVNKMPVRRAKAAASLAAAVESQGREVAAGFEERVARVLREGETAPDVAHLMDVVARLVRLESRELVDVDEAATLEGMGTQRIRRECREALAPVRAVIVAWRKRMVGIYGAQETASLLELKGRTPRSVEDLDLLAEHLLRRLPVMELPEVGGVKVDPTAWAEELRPAYKRLRRASAALCGRQWGEENVLHAKARALEAFDGTYSLAVRLFEILYYLAGQKFLAKRLRPGILPELRGGGTVAEDPTLRSGGDGPGWRRAWALPRPVARWLGRRSSPEDLARKRVA